MRLYIIEAKSLNFEGFTLKHGYAVLKINGSKEGFFFTSGHSCGGYIYLYHRDRSGQYQPSWVDIELLANILGQQFQDYLEQKGVL